MDKIPSELYKQILENMPIPCVDIVVYYDGKVLLVKRKEEPAKNEWWVPGGRVLKNEKLEDAVKRKIKEETGLDVTKIKKLGAQEYFSDKTIFGEIKTGTHAVVVIYLVEIGERNVEIDDTSSEYKWIDKIEEDLNPYVKKALKKAKIFD